MRGCDELTLTGRGSDLGYSVFCAAHIAVCNIRQAVQSLRNASIVGASVYRPQHMHLLGRLFVVHAPK
jgi:hypothetical protein